MRDLTAKLLSPTIFCLAFFLALPNLFAADVSSVYFPPAGIPALPQQHLGAFTGSSGGALIVAGGIPGAGQSPTDTIFLLQPGQKDWQQQTLETPMAWGASAQVNDSLICIGGFDGQTCSTKVIRLQFVNGKLVQTSLPDLPYPCAWSGAAVLGQTIFIVGGTSAPDFGQPRNDVLTIDLSSPSPAWKHLTPLPGPGRVQPIVVGQYNTLEIFGGRTRNSSDGFQTLSDAWSYRPHPWDGTVQHGWIKISDLPLPLAASAAIPVGEADTLIVSADSQSSVSNLLNAAATAQTYPKTLSYHTITDSWVAFAGDAIQLNGASAVHWNDQTILIGGASDAPPNQLILKPLVRHLSFIDWGIVAAYFLVVAAIGIHFARHQKSSEEFALAGRRMPWWVAALSLYATATSSISMMAVPALGYASNLVWLLLPFLGIIVLIPQAFLIIPMIRRLNLTSTYEYLEKRFNPTLRMLGSLQCIIYYSIGKASIVILLPSLAVSAVTGLNVYYCVIAMGLLTTVYTALGGIDAVMWTDVLQAIMMLLAPTVTMIAIVIALPGGAHQVLQTGIDYDKWRLAIMSWNPTQPVVWIWIVTMLLSVTGFAGDQAMVQRVLATPDDKTARKATLGNYAVCTGGAILCQVVGILLFAYFHANPGKLDPTMAKDKIVPLFVVQVMPRGLAGLIIAGLMAASVSCLSGTVNSVSTLMVQDFYRRLRPHASDRQRLRMMKLCSYLVGCVSTTIAAILAGMQMQSVMQTWTTIGSLCGAGFVGVYTLGMFTRRATSAGAITGAISSVIITFAVKEFTAFHWSLYLPLAIVTCIVVGYLTSLFTPQTQRNLSGLTAYTPVRHAGHAQAKTSLATAAS
jgi:solute:Na+ symporter, SSS family